MLIRFSISNFLSFNEEVEFSMIPGRVRKHPHHVVRDDAWNGIDVLRSAVIYGASASGKSNLVKAFEFCRRLIAEGTKPKAPIDLHQFKFDKESRSRPSRFEFEFKISDEAYAYGFEITSQRVLSEWLYSITKTSSKPLFERGFDAEGNTNVEFGKIDISDEEERQFLQFTARGTRQNQLFLTELIERDVRFFEHIYGWFRNDLIMIFPESQYRDLEIEIETDEQLRTVYELLLHQFNTGISGIRFKGVDFENDLDLPRDVRIRIEKDAQLDSRLVLRGADNRRFLLHKKKTGEIDAYELVTEHRVKDSADTELLELAFESDGTQRLFDLIPALHALASSDKVFIVDELDRSLHPSLSYMLMQTFFDAAKDTSSQLIVTTHETSLLDLDLLRRDEIWFIEKDKNGSSSLYSLEEFTPRYDKDIRKGYLRGRFGAIPVIHDVSTLGWAN